MKSSCPVCRQTYRGIALNTVKDGKAVEVCPNCYKTLDAEYRKNSCYACAFFQSGTCELFGTELEEPYIQNLKCGFYTTSKDEATIAKAKARKYEVSGKFEDAAREYEKIGMTHEAVATRKKAEKNPQKILGLEEGLEQLSQRGQVLTYYCCHCGAQLKVGDNKETLKVCPKCKYDLSAINLAKLISQHL